MQGVKGEAVVVYADPLTTQQMLCHRLSLRVNNMAVFPRFLDIIRSAFHNGDPNGRKDKLLLLLKTFCHVIYATIG